MRGRPRWIRSCRGTGWSRNDMPSELEQKVAELLKSPQNMGELADADAVGSVGNSSCGELLRMWVKFKEQDGRKVIDRATFQSFGCETAIAVASLATELIRGKTAAEALSLRTDELSGDLGPLPPMKIHCAELVEGALRSALEGQGTKTETAGADMTPSLTDSLMAGQQASGKVKVVILPPSVPGR